MPPEYFKVAIADSDPPRIAFGTQPGSADAFTREAAEQRAALANEQAEALGLKTRYVVVPA